MQSKFPTPLEKTCIILGAGATRGSSLAKGGPKPLPPLDRDFFTQLQRIKNPKYTEYIERLLVYCHTEFGSSWSLSMEKFFNHIWYVRSFVGPKNIKLSGKLRRDITGKDLWVKRRIALQDLFKQVLLGVLEESLFGNHSANIFSETCDLHNVLAQKFEPSDSVVSFNYDCVMDVSLASHCRHWNPVHSYGFLPLVENIKYWRKNGASGKDNLVHLFKMHGSINWQLRGDHVRLVQRPYTRQNSDRDFFIVPPVLSKDRWMTGSLHQVWKSASGALDEARSVVVIGYSAPDIDALAMELLRTRSQRQPDQAIRKLKYLIVADPNQSVRKRIRDIFRRSIGPKTRVLSFDSFAELVQYGFST